MCAVRPEKDVEALDDEDEKERLTATFEPDFVYPIFGEEETVYGYKDLKIKLYFGERLAHVVLISTQHR